MEDKHLPMQFTELFIPIEDAGKVMTIMKQFWSENAYWMHTGSFNWEFYLG